MAKQKTGKKGSKFVSIFSDLKDNVSEGAKALGNMSVELFEEAKEKAEDFYESGSEKFEQASGVVQNYVTQYKDERQMKKLTSEKNELNSLLGDAIFHEFKKNGTIAKRFMSTKKITDLVGQIGKVDKNILKIGKELDKSAKT